MAGQELKEALTAVEQQQQQFGDLPLEQRHPDPAVPITFTKVCFVSSANGNAYFRLI